MGTVNPPNANMFETAFWRPLLMTCFSYALLNVCGVDGVKVVWCRLFWGFHGYASCNTQHIQTSVPCTFISPHFLWWPHLTHLLTCTERIVKCWSNVFNLRHVMKISAPCCNKQLSLCDKALVNRISVAVLNYACLKQLSPNTWSLGQ